MSTVEQQLQRLEERLQDDMQRELAPQQGDSSLLAGLVAGATDTPIAVPEPSTPTAAAASSKTSLALAALLGGGLVLAGVIAASVLNEPAPPAAAPAEAPSAPTVAPETPTPESDPIPKEAAAPVEVEDAEPAERPRPRTASTTKSPAATPDAASMFARANQLRRERDYDAAEQAYERLSKAHPGSREEVMARVTRGRLLLDVRDRPRQALDLFDRYLESAPRGTLAEEAMVGRALSLEAMGKPDAAREAWSTLLERFPDSLQATRARAAVDGQ